MKRSYLPAIASACIGLLLMCGSQNGGNGSGVGNGIVTGTVYNGNGNAAPYATVRFYKADYNPLTGGLGKTVAATATAGQTITTDGSGFYSTVLEAGAYTLLASGDSGKAFQDSVIVRRADTTFPQDTLRTPGGLQGVIRLRGGDDPRTTFIIFLGTDTLKEPDDSLGNFTINNLAAGTHRVRILSTLDKYRPKDTLLTVISGTTTTIPPIQLSYTGIPVPTGLHINYDTMKQIVTLIWNKPTTGAKVGGYTIYRGCVDSNKTPTTLTSKLVTDTTYADSTGIQDLTYKYQVSATDTNGNTGDKCAGVQVKFSTIYQSVGSIILPGGDGSSTIVVSKSGIIVDRTDDIITVFDSSFRLLGSFNLPSDFGNGFGHEIDDSNKIWAANYNTGRINVYDLTGNLQFAIQDTGLWHPNILKQSRDGKMFIVSSKDGLMYQIRMYTLSGKFISIFPNNISSISLTMVADMDFDDNGNLIIINPDDSTISQYDMNGAMLKSVKLMSYLTRIKTLSNGNFAIEQDGSRGIINVRNSALNLLSIFGNVAGIDYRDYGRLSVGTHDRLIIRKFNSILFYASKQ